MSIALQKAQRQVSFLVGDSDNDSNDSVSSTEFVKSAEPVIKQVKPRKKREAVITDELKPHLNSEGTHCLRCNTKTKDVDLCVADVKSRKKEGGLRGVIKCKCSFCGANKTKFLSLNKELTHSPNGTYCFDCKRKTDDIDVSTVPVNETAEYIKSKCSECNADKSRYANTKPATIVELPVENLNLGEQVEQPVATIKKRGRKPKVSVVSE